MEGGGLDFDLMDACGLGRFNNKSTDNVPETSSDEDFIAAEKLGVEPPSAIELQSPSSPNEAKAEAYKVQT